MPKKLQLWLGQVKFSSGPIYLVLTFLWLTQYNLSVWLTAAGVYLSSSFAGWSGADPNFRYTGDNEFGSSDHLIPGMQ